MNKKFLLPLLLVGLLSGCNSGADNSSSVNSVFDSSSSLGEEYPTISVEPGYEYTHDLSYTIGSCIVNIINDVPLAVGNEYVLNFDFSNADSSLAVITSSNESILVIEQKEGINSPIVKCLSAGDSILTIKDGDGLIHFRYVVHVRPKLDTNTAEEYLVSVDYWKSVAPQWSGGEYDMIFVGNGIGYFNVYEGGYLAGQYTLNIEYKETLDEFIVFSITAIEPANSQLRLREIYLEITGYEIALYDVISHDTAGNEQLGLFDLFRPQSNV